MNAFLIGFLQRQTGHLGLPMRFKDLKTLRQTLIKRIVRIIGSEPDIEN